MAEEKEYAKNVGIDGLEEIYVKRADDSKIYLNINLFFMLKWLFENKGVKVHLEKGKYTKEKEEASKRKYGLTT